jgi:hypothetical protein
MEEFAPSDDNVFSPPILPVVFVPTPLKRSFTSSSSMSFFSTLSVPSDSTFHSLSEDLALENSICINDDDYFSVGDEDLTLENSICINDDDYFSVGDDVKNEEVDEEDKCPEEVVTDLCVEEKDGEEVERDNTSGECLVSLHIPPVVLASPPLRRSMRTRRKPLLFMNEYERYYK